MKNFFIFSLFLLFGFIILISGCGQQSNFQDNSQISRYDKIPEDAIKITPEDDANPPKSYSSDYSNPIPISGRLNSAGAEDSAFILPDGNTLYFFFTPDVNVPVEKQILDGVTGIWMSKKESNGEFGEPERIFLQDKNKLALDGCEFIDNNVMLFCSAREGYTGINWFSALFNENKNNWEFDKIVEFPAEYEIGELHEYNDEIYYHSSRAGGQGGLDIWKIKRNSDGTWTEPENIKEINTAGNEGWPAISPDGNELWLTKDYGLWRSKKDDDGKWQIPELIISPLAGEATIDNHGNVYFTHHFYKDNKMIEADIYVAYKK